MTRIEISGLDADAEPPRLRVMFQFAGHRLFADPSLADTAADGETLFVGLLDLTLSADGSWPWQLASGHVETLDQFLGYVFTSRRETPQEYRERTGSPADTAPANTPPADPAPADPAPADPAATGAARRFRIVAGLRRARRAIWFLGGDRGAARNRANS